MTWWQTVSGYVTKAARYSLAAGKGLVAAGAGNFAVDETVKWAAQGGTGSGLDSWWGKGLAGAAALTALATNMVIRIPNMLRDKSKKKPAVIEQAEPLLEDNDDSSDDMVPELDDESADMLSLAPIKLTPIGHSQPQQVKQQEHSCCHPAFQTSTCGTATWVGARVLTGGYAFYTGLSGYLSAFSISQFFASSLNAMFPDYVSDKMDDAEWKLWVVHVFAVYLFASNFASYVNSNMANILEKYLPGLIRGEWKEYSWKVYAKVLPFILINAVNAKFSLDKTAGLLNKYTLNNISSNLVMPDFVSKIFSSVGVATYFGNFTIVNVPSMHNLHKPEDRSAEFAREIPEYYRWRHLFKAMFAGDSVATGAVSARAVAYSLHEMFGVDDQHLATKICALLIAGGFVAYNTYASDKDACEIQFGRWVEDKKTRNAAMVAVQRSGAFSQSGVGIEILAPDAAAANYKRLQ